MRHKLHKILPLILCLGLGSNIALAQQQQRPQLHLSAQTHALDFYKQLGFEQQGEVYLECNIPHIHMQLLFIENSP